jgi:hypothetical protein
MKRLVAVLVTLGALAGPAAIAQGKMDCGKPTEISGNGWTVKGSPRFRLSNWLA